MSLKDDDTVGLCRGVARNGRSHEKLVRVSEASIKQSTAPNSDCPSGPINDKELSVLLDVLGAFTSHPKPILLDLLA